MLKKFVPLNSNQSPSRNPYEIRTYVGEQLRPSAQEWKTDVCQVEINCEKPQNSTLAQVLTLEDEIRRIHLRTKEDHFKKNIKPKCVYTDEFTECVRMCRTPKQLRRHIVGREGYLKIKRQMNSLVHDMDDLYSEHPSQVRLESPFPSEGGEEDQNAAEGEEEDESIKVLLATPECSMDVMYYPTQRLLELKRPKSGVFINETQPPKLTGNDDIPYTTYNPRLLQEKFDAQNLKRIDVIDGPRSDLWTWNIGVQQGDEDIDRTLLEANIPPFDCNNLELISYNIPNDLEKTFSAGIVFGNTVVPKYEPMSRFEFYKRPNEMACLFVAYVESFRLNADFWTAATMDNIIVMGEKLVAKSVKLNYKSDTTDYDIIPEIKERDAVIDMKLHFSGPMTSQPNIYKALTIYFSKYNACILCSKNLYLLIWKRCLNFFYVYDPNGRTENCERDFENGKCALMSTHFIEHLVHLIVNIGQTDIKSEFNLYEIMLLNFGKIVDKLSNKPYPKRLHRQWAVINYAYAVIPSCNYGLLQPKSAEEANSSILVGVIALLYSYIQRPNTWDTNVVDQIIRIGTAYFKSLRRALHLGKNGHVNIVDVPDKYVLGYYKASIRKNPFFYTGTVTEYCKRFTDSLLACGLRELFASKWEAALLQIDSSVVAIWRDDCLYYVFDPFRRGKCGQVLESDKVRGLAIVQFHATFDSLLRMLYQNALKMRRGGKFFIHGINVGCIKPIIDGKKRKLRYTGLKLTPDVLEDEELLAIEQPELSDSEDEKKRKKKIEEDNRKKMLKKMNKKQRDAFLKKEKKEQKEKKKREQKEKKDKKKLEKMCESKKGLSNKKCFKVCSIPVIPLAERFAAFEDSEMVESLVEEIVCEVMHKLAEPPLERERLYKSANRVLLRSDKEYLENLKYMVNRGIDYDNYDNINNKQPALDELIPTLEDELAIPSNFCSLPDGSWVLFGCEIIQRLDDEQSKLCGLLSCLVTAALTTRYKISTWNATLIDFAIRAVDTFGEEFQVYQYALGAFFTKRLPRICIGKYEYDVRIKRIIKSDLQKSLREVLLESLISNTRILVICQRFSVLIIKRYNFLYMFIGYSVNQVGYRKIGSGPACILRFIELDSLIRRIEYGCNPMGCNICDYIVVNLSVVDVSPFSKDRYKPYPADIDQRIYNEEYQRMRKARESKMAKMRFLTGEINKENARISEFMKAKQDHERRKATCKKRGRHLNEPYEYEYECMEDEEMMEEGEEECEVSPKHKFGRKMDKLRDEFKPRPVLYGYRLREKDYLYKIQGSRAIEGRSDSVSNKIKPCFFTSTLAILYAILRPLNQWTSQRVDQLIDNSNLLADKIDDMCTAYERTIRNINVDDYTFDILIRVYEPMGMGLQLQKQLEQGTSVRKYLLLHTANCTYAIYRDDYFHLFDPYRSMETGRGDDEEEEGEEETKSKRPKILKGLRKYGERNTASWVLFADIESMIEYMDKRACSSSWKEDHEYTFHVVDVLTYKKSSKNAQVLQLLTGMAPCSPGDVKEAARCAHNESIAWLEHCLPVWSRLNRRNAAGYYRNMGISKFKKYDIEIQDRLWSLWGTLHPNAPVFETTSRGKQFLACCVMCIGAAHMYRMIDWTPQLLDSIIVNGDRYHQQSVNDIKCENYEFFIEDLNLECWLDSMRFMVHVEHVIYGTLYCQPHIKRMNLSNALMYFFTYYRFGILQCLGKCMAIGYIPGYDGGYFMYDCQSREHPLYPKGQGASCVLRTYHLQVLLYCIIITLNVPYYNVQFAIHKVEMIPEGASVEGDNENAEGRSQEV